MNAREKSGPRSEMFDVLKAGTILELQECCFSMA